MISTSLIIKLMIAQLPQIETIPLDLINTSGFSKIEIVSRGLYTAHGGHESINAIRTSDGTGLYIKSTILRNLKETIKPLVDAEQYDNMALWLFTPDSPSGIGLGSHSLWYYKKASCASKSSADTSVWTRKCALVRKRFSLVR